MPLGATRTTVAEPALAIRLAGTAAVSWVELTNVVVRAVDPHLTVVPEGMLDPLTTRVNAGPVAVVEFGLSDEMEGGGLIVNVAFNDCAPFGFLTATVAEPAYWIALAGMLTNRTDELQ